jgi:hypothetical protein
MARKTKAQIEHELVEANRELTAMQRRCAALESLAAGLQSKLTAAKKAASRGPGPLDGPADAVGMLQALTRDARRLAGKGEHATLAECWAEISAQLTQDPEGPNLNEMTHYTKALGSVVSDYCASDCPIEILKCARDRLKTLEAALYAGALEIALGDLPDLLRALQEYGIHDAEDLKDRIEHEDDRFSAKDCAEIERLLWRCGFRGPDIAEIVIRILDGMWTARCA